MTWSIFSLYFKIPSEYAFNQSVIDNDVSIS
jgi:hypothetical protein